MSFQSICLLHTVKISFTPKKKKVISLSVPVSSRSNTQCDKVMVRKWFITLKMRICHQEALHFSKRRRCVIPLMIRREYPTILHFVLVYSCIQNIPGVQHNNDEIVCSTKHWIEMLCLPQMRFSSLADIHRKMGVLYTLRIWYHHVVHVHFILHV